MAVARKAPECARAGLIGCGTTNDRTAQRIRGQILFQEFLHLATAFADQCDDIDVGLRVPLIMPSSTLFPSRWPAKTPTFWPRHTSVIH